MVLVPFRFRIVDKHAVQFEVSVLEVQFACLVPIREYCFAVGWLELAFKSIRLLVPAALCVQWRYPDIAQFFLIRKSARFSPFANVIQVPNASSNDRAGAVFGRYLKRMAADDVLLDFALEIVLQAPANFLFFLAFHEYVFTDFFSVLLLAFHFGAITAFHPSSVDSFRRPIRIKGLLRSRSEAEHIVVGLERRSDQRSLSGRVAPNEVQRRNANARRLCGAANHDFR